MKIPQYLYSASYEDLQRYMALLIQQMQSDLSDNGWQVPQLTAAQIVNVTRGIPIPNVASFFQPVLRPGTLWFNTDISKLQFITVQAVPNISNATIETITSA